MLKNLHLGTYTIKEVQAPENFYNGGEEKTVTLSYAGQNVETVFSESTFVNERQKVEVSLEKALETSELFGIGNNGEIKNISFACSPMRSLYPQAALPIPKDGLLENHYA